MSNLETVELKNEIRQLKLVINRAYKTYYQAVKNIKQSEDVQINIINNLLLNEKKNDHSSSWSW